MIRSVATRAGKRSVPLQMGFMLLELMLTLAVISALGIMGLARQVEELGDSRMVAQGKALITLQAAQNTYITTYYNELLNGLPVPLPAGGNVVDPMNPTIAELIALNIGLPTSFSNVAFNGGNYQVRILNNAGQLEAEAWIDRPFLAPNGTPDLPRLGVATQTIGPDGGFSVGATPAMYRTRSMAIDQANPAGAVAGILVARAGYNTQSMLAFLRRDGTLPMTGDLRMGNQDINDVTDINADGRITASDLVSDTGTIDTLTSTSITTNSLATNVLTANTGTINALTSSGITNSGAYTGAGLIRTTADVEAANMTASGLMKAASIETGSLTASGNLSVTGTATMASQTITGNQTVQGNTVVQGALVPGLIASGGSFCGANPGAIARDASNNLYICN